MKLLVAGCSFSGYYGVDKTYGNYLSEKLQTDAYIQEAHSGGSNYRIWRKVVEHVLSNHISSNDVVIVQYTEESRQEFWSPYQRNLIEDFDNSEIYPSGGRIIGFCVDGHEFKHNHKNESSFMKLQEFFLNERFENEKFTMYHNMFQTFMIYHGFRNLFFLKGGTYGPSYNLINEYKENFIDGSHFLKDYPGKDIWHLSDLGHQRISELIYNSLKNKIN